MYFQLVLTALVVYQIGATDIEGSCPPCNCAVSGGGGGGSGGSSGGGSGENFAYAPAPAPAYAPAPAPAYAPAPAPAYAPAPAPAYAPAPAPAPASSGSANYDGDYQGPPFPELPPAPAAPAGGWPSWGSSISQGAFTTGDTTVYAHCPYNSTVTWNVITYKSTSPRPYFVNKGNLASFQDCVNQCQASATCYFALMTKRKTCYFLTTNAVELCRYIKVGHWGKIKVLERCGPLNPCQGAFKQCYNPRCTLYQIARIYCETQDVQKAVDTCYL